MAESSRYRPGGGRRSPVLYNPARASMPVGLSYDPYGSDLHAVPTSRHESVVLPRGAHDHRPTNSIPVTTTTYAVRKDHHDAALGRGTSLSHGPGSGSGAGRAHRSSTLDSGPKRPPIIVTTTKHAPSGSHTSPGLRPPSPSRDPFRSSDEGLYYTQPASSIQRSRSHTRAPYTAAALDNDEYARLRERTADDRLRASRPAEYRPPPRRPALYADLPRHPAAIDYGDAGYEYTKPSDLARYDLDPSRPPRRPRRESFDRNYYRPSVSVTTDIGRPYEPNDRRPRYPPPTTRGQERVVARGPPAAAGIYDTPQIRLPVPRAPAPPPAPSSPNSDRYARPHPASLYQEVQGWPPHHESLYRSREDPLLQRELRERDRDYLADDGVPSRGFGIRLDAREPDEARLDPEPPRHRDRDERRERRERREYDPDREPRRRADEDVELARPREDRKTTYESRETKLSSRDDVSTRYRREGRDKDDRPGSSDEDRESKKGKGKEKVIAGLGLAAASAGLDSALRSRDDRDDKEVKLPVRSRRDKDDYDRKEVYDDADTWGAERPKSGRRDPDERKPRARDDGDAADGARDRDRPRKERTPDAGPSSRDETLRDDDRRRDRSTSEEDGKAGSSTRRRRASAAAFNPNDASDLQALKAQLAATEEAEKAAASDKPTTREPSSEKKEAPPPPHPASSGETALVPATKDDDDDDDDDDARGRELAPPASHDEKQVRVVSPPRDREEKKPLKGILKQPSSKFPEEPNPVREGVAPHKDDKTKANVPPGARWTKINRQLVNPEALTIGKERFEVRDDFVIVLRVLSKEEIQAYATATAQLRERRRREYEKALLDGGYDEPEREDDEEKRRARHRHHRRDPREEEYYEDERRERNRDKYRRYRHDDDYELEPETRPKAIEHHSHAHHRSHRDAERRRSEWAD